MIIHKVCLKKRICDYYHFIFILEQFEVIGGYFSVTLSIMKAYFAFCFISSQALSLITYPVSLRINSAVYTSLRFTNKLCFQSLCAKLPVFKQTWPVISVGWVFSQFLFVLLVRGTGKPWMLSCGIVSVRFQLGGS